MNSPFKNIHGAFEVFYDEDAVITTSDGTRTSFKVCVFTDGTADPLSDDMLDSEREDMTFIFKRKDWPFVKKLTRGATIKRLCDAKEYSVSDVKFDHALGWMIAAREA